MSKEVGCLVLTNLEEIMTTKAERIQQKENYARKQRQIASLHGTKTKSTKHCSTSAMTCGSSRCVMCGNPRKMFSELTIQEQRMFQED